MHIKNYRNFVSGIICIVCSIACCFVLLRNGFSIKYLIGLVLTVVLCLVNMKGAFDENLYEKAFINELDERDAYITMKSGYTTLRIMNIALLIITILTILLYVLTKRNVFMVIAMTLCFIIIMMFIILLSVNVRYEKSE